jgi:hypothetical protein
LRGRDAVAALFPDQASYGGDFTMFGNSGVRTLSGGDILAWCAEGDTRAVARSIARRPRDVVRI